MCGPRQAVSFAPMRPSSQLEIDLRRLDENLAAMRGLVGPAVRVCGVVKADAYGLGAATIGRRLAAAGIDMLAVYSPEQAAELLQAGIERPVMVLMPVRELEAGDSLHAAARRGQLHLTIQDADQIESLERCATQFGCRIHAHLHLDTGMSRGGMHAEEFVRAIDRLRGSKGLRPAGAYTHFSSAEEDAPFTEEQMAAFENVLARVRPMLPGDFLVHAANTAAAHRHQRFHQTMIRVGLGLLGYGPSLIKGQWLKPDAGVQPILRWRTRLVHVGRFPKGAAVGYNRTHILRRDSVLGVVPIGYADGYPLALGNKGAMELLSVSVPVLGKVNMDQTVLDLTDAPANAARVGAEVLAISDDPRSPCCVERLAERANSSCYELLCRLSPRIPRVYA